MTVYTWPETKTWVPASAELRVVDSLQRVHESSLSGYVQTQSMPGARWGWAYDMAPQSIADRQALEAWLLRLSGREHRVRLWDHKHPRPRGNIGTAGVTLGPSAAQFATSLVLAGCVSARNLLSNSGFETDSNADGLADGWSSLTSGTVGTVTRGLASAAGQTNTAGLCQRLVSTTLDGLLGVGRQVSVTPGVTYSLAVTQLASPGVTVNVEIGWYTAGSAPISSSISAAAGTGAAGRRAVTGVAPPTAALASLSLYITSTSGALSQVYLDEAQFEVGAASDYAGPATLLAGDWLGLSTGQLVRVVADAVANDAGAMTVEVRHMLRTAVPSGSAVTLEKPTALFVRTDSGLAMPRMPGNAEPGMSLEFVEVFA